MINAHRSYDAVFGSPMPQVGLGVEWKLANHWVLGANADYGQVDGEQVLITDNSTISTGVGVTLTYIPVRATAGFVLDPEGSWRWRFGAGPAWVSWKDDSRGGSSGNALGAHLLVGLRHPSRHVTWGADLDWSTIPNAVGDGGVTKFYNEDDVGGLTLTLIASW